MNQFVLFVKASIELNG